VGWLQWLLGHGVFGCCVGHGGTGGINL